MSVTTSTSTSSSGTTTTVGTTVRNEGGGGGDPHVVDVFLSLDASLLQHEPSGSPDPAASAHSEITLMCWWKDRVVQPDSEIDFDYKVKWRASASPSDTATGFVVVFDRNTDEVHYHDISFGVTAPVILKPFSLKSPKAAVLKKKRLPRPKPKSRVK
jgi:hypothetical protein